MLRLSESNFHPFFLNFFIAAGSLCTPLASVGAKPADNKVPVGYHLAQSVAEITLNAIIRKSEKDNGLNDFVLGDPFYKANKVPEYKPLFTDEFLRAVRSQQRSMVKKDCKGKYLEGEICGLDSSPINCAQDQSDKAYLYRTDSMTATKAIISYRWQDSLTEGEAGQYKLVNQGGRWEIFGVKCGNGGFNFNFG